MIRSYGRRVGIAFALIFLSGCEVPVMLEANANQGEMTGTFEITFPAAMYIRWQDGTDAVYSGEMKGKANGSASWIVSNDSGSTCEGSVDAKGIGQVTCDNAFTYTIDEPMSERLGMSGIRITTDEVLGQSMQVAFGWGNHGNENSVRAALK